jgi:hypothetical protein
VGKTMVKQNTINIYEILGKKQHIGLKKSGNGVVFFEQNADTGK